MKMQTKIPKVVSDLLFNQLLAKSDWNFAIGIYICVSAFNDSDGSTNPDDDLAPVAKLEKYASSENIFNR